MDSNEFLRAGLPRKRVAQADSALSGCRVLAATSRSCSTGRTGHREIPWTTSDLVTYVPGQPLVQHRRTGGWLTPLTRKSEAANIRMC